MMNEAHPLQRWKLTLAYDGEPFAGWQSQPCGNAVQDHVENALRLVTKSPVRLPVHASGRTDAGVHAEGQVAHFDASSKLTLSGSHWVRAMNANLHPRIRVMACEAATNTFHARFSAKRKTYGYRFYFGETLPPHYYKRAWQLHRALQISDIQKALGTIVGEHDFKNFAVNRGKNASAPLSTRRTIFDSRYQQVSEFEGLLTITGDGFLYKMVRMLVGTLVDLERGRLTKVEFDRLLNAERLLKRSACAPAEGLYLLRVAYGSSRNETHL